MDESILKDFQDLYEVCMNKNPETRPKASQLLGSYII